MHASQKLPDISTSSDDRVGPPVEESAGFIGLWLFAPMEVPLGQSRSPLCLTHDRCQLDTFIK